MASDLVVPRTISQEIASDPVASDARRDDISREVFCILGVPVDAIGMPSLLRCIDRAAARKKPFVISTPNLNFLVQSQSDPEFRESLLLSDLCLPDGMPIVWIARLSGIPIKHRVAGADILNALKTKRNPTRPLQVFLFGGADGVAAAACSALNREPERLSCVGWLYPGFGTVDDLSRDNIVREINSCNADFLVASLGAQKGQLWLRRNHDRLRIPIRAHLGASINFEAGTVARAPLIMQKNGLEWLWRVKEEPYLWRRYWYDGKVLLRLLITRVLPVAIWTWWLALRHDRHGKDLIVNSVMHRRDCHRPPIWRCYRAKRSEHHPGI